MKRENKKDEQPLWNEVRTKEGRVLQNKAIERIRADADNLFSVFQA